MRPDSKQLDDVSRFLSYVLRHEPQRIGLTLDTEGWAEIDSLIIGAAANGLALDRAAIETVAANSEKKRFAISQDGQRIRAVQGHSTPVVQRRFSECMPPEVLYHGTATRFIESIFTRGLEPGDRHHVHLTHDVDAAVSIGKRYGKPVVLEVLALQMHDQGFKFFLTENNVWLTDIVPVKFLNIHSA
jgi:putative RNA 2'-phosphotransferase